MSLQERLQPRQSTEQQNSKDKSTDLKSLHKLRNILGSISMSELVRFHLPSPDFLRITGLVPSDDIADQRRLDNDAFWNIAMSMLSTFALQPCLFLMKMFLMGTKPISPATLFSEVRRRS